MKERKLIHGMLLSALVAVGLVTGMPPSSTAAQDGKPIMQVSGEGGGRLGTEWGDLEGDPVWFEIDARTVDPLNPSGSFHVIHRKPDGRLLAEFSGRVTSLATVDEVGVLTGVIENAEHPDLPLEFVGSRVAFTVYDGHAHDRIGWVWGFFGAPVNPLQGTAPTFPLSSGGFQVQGDLESEVNWDASPRGHDPAVALTKEPENGTIVRAVLGGASKSPAIPGSRLRFDLAGRITPGGNPTEVTGGFHVSHHAMEGSALGDFAGRLTCLTVGGPVAIATGVVTKSANPELVGQQVSFALKDGRIDRLGWLWGFAVTEAPISDCQSTVPFYAPDWGGLVVH